MFNFYFPEFELRQAKGLVDKETILLTVEDPQSHVGSGGATINALLAITEYISACKGYTVSCTLFCFNLPVVFCISLRIVTVIVHVMFSKQVC